ncbi:MAG: hypothetical protein LN409_03430, partial [Candidatus Thermoplasmatota archaeon]|nr:hypothetical protein [Candidatus Thermoplasmatota archaeon]
KAFMAVYLYTIAGEMDYTIAVLDEHGVQVPEARRALREFENQLRRLYEEDREELARYVNLGLKRRFRSIEETLKEVLPPDPEFLYDYPPEYESVVYDARESIELAHDAAKKLGHKFDFELYMERLRGLDAALRESIPFTVAEMMKYGHEHELTDWHPKRFWWRYEARECYEEMSRTKPKSR